MISEHILEQVQLSLERYVLAIQHDNSLSYDESVEIARSCVDLMLSSLEEEWATGIPRPAPKSKAMREAAKERGEGVYEITTDHWPRLNDLAGIPKQDEVPNETKPTDH